MREIKALSEKFNFKIIEDASHAIGGKYLKERIGSCKYSDITVFSFHPVKIITTGEGGIATTNDSKLRDKMNSLRSHGISRNSHDLSDRPKNEIWNYDQNSIGFNYRIPDINCALGLSQLKNLQFFIERRQEIAKKYNLAFKNTCIKTPWQSPDTSSSFHLYPIRLKSIKPKLNRNYLYQKLKEINVGVNITTYQFIGIPITKNGF